VHLLQYSKPGFHLVDSVIAVVLMQVTDYLEHIITYLSHCLIDAEIRYSFIEKLCLSLFYAFLN
jgi:hypothetical protein